jgi:hypothetical protein
VGKGRGSHSSEDARAHVISGQKRMEIELLDGTIPRRKMGLPGCSHAMCQWCSTVLCAGGLHSDTTPLLDSSS